MTIILHPPELLAAAESHRIPLGGGIIAELGFDPDVAQVVANITRDTMRLPIRTASFVDGDGASLFAAFHSGTIEGGAAWIELSLAPGGLPIRRDVLEIVTRYAFDEERATHLVVRVKANDLALRDVLRRLGFGRVMVQDGRHLYALAADRLPECWRRFRARRSH